MVSFEVAPLAPGVTELGENEQVERDGRLEQASETALVNAPYCGLTLTVYVADRPGLTLALDGEGLIAKLVTAIWTVLADGEFVAPPLFAVRVSRFTPSGHVSVALAPVAVPQAPLQFSVSAQLSGSALLPLSVTVAPLALVPFTV
jgi:hypothetical protein